MSTSVGPRTRTDAGRTVVGDPPPEGGRIAELRSVTSGIVSAGQALVLSLAVVVLPAVLAVLLSAGSSSSDDGWGGAVSVALGLWLLGHGVPWAVAGVTITLAPVGITLLALFSAQVAARRTAHATLGSWVAATSTYAIVTFALALVTRSTSGWWVLSALVGGAVVGGLGTALGILARPTSPRVTDLLPVWARGVLARGVGLGLRAATVALLLALVAAAVVTTCWAFAGRSTTSDVLAGLAPGTVGGIVLGVAQSVLVPNLVIWALAWIAGPGFAIGTGSVFAPGDQVSGPMPALPMLGSLPGPGWVDGPALLAPLLVVVAGAVAGWYVWRDGRRGAGVLVTATLTAALGAGLAAGGLVALASGAVGPGSMVDVGGAWFVTGAAVAVEVAAGAAIVVGVAAGGAALRRRRSDGQRHWHDVADEA